MKNDTVNYVLVGSFVVAMLGALLFAIALLTGRTGATNTYFTRYQDATGLKYGSQVLYMGFPVGQVEEIRAVLVNGEVRFDVEMSVIEELRNWNVPADSVAEIRAAGLLAANTIDIRAGSSDQALEPGEHIEGRGQTDVFGAVQETANTLRDLTTTSLKPLLESLNLHVSRFGQVLDTEGGPLIENLGVLSEELSKRAPEVIADFLRTTADLRSVSGRLRAVLSDENTRKVGTVMDNVVLASEDLARLADNAREQLDLLLGPANLSTVKRLVGDAAETASEALALSRSTRAGMDRLLSDDNLSSVNRALASVEAAAGEAHTVVREARDVVGVDNRARVQRALDNLEQASAQMRSLVDQDTQDAVDATMQNVERASQGLDALVADTRVQVDALLGSGTRDRLDHALDNVSSASANIAQLSSALDARLGEVLTLEMSDKLKRSLDNFASAAASIAKLSNGLLGSRQRLDALLVNLNETTAENRGEIRDSVRALRHALRIVSRHIDTVANNLEGTSRNMFELSRRLKGNPGLLLRTPQAEDEAQTATSGG